MFHLNQASTWAAVWANLAKILHLSSIFDAHTSSRISLDQSICEKSRISRYKLISSILWAQTGIFCIEETCTIHVGCEILFHMVFTQSPLPNLCLTE